MPANTMLSRQASCQPTHIPSRQATCQPTHILSRQATCQPTQILSRQATATYPGGTLPEWGTHTPLTLQLARGHSGWACMAPAPPPHSEIPSPMGAPHTFNQYRQTELTTTQICHILATVPPVDFPGWGAVVRVV